MTIPADSLTFYQTKTPNPVSEITPGVPIKPVWYKDYRRATPQSFDIALHTPTSYAGRAIARHTGGYGFNFCHAEAIVWWHIADRMMSCGYQEGMGGVARPLSQEVAKSNGNIHIFRVKKWDCQSDRCLASHFAGDLGRAYGWHTIALQFLTLLPLARFLLPSRLMKRLVMAASASSGVGICSQHVARSFRACGLSLVDKPDAMITPNDIAQSALTEYICTLVKGEDDEPHTPNWDYRNWQP